jgi:16S rRNA (cytosine967-C5)-methyltransferase
MNTSRYDSVPGLHSRRAALRLLDAVLRRGETLDNAAHGATQGMSGPDKALARALAGEALRWMGDFDAMIDGATRMPLAPDAKARNVLRLMLAGWLRLETPPHAVIATGLELLMGGPRRLAHGVFSALVRAGVTLPDAPSLPDAVAGRWGARAALIAQGIAVPPPLDISVKDGGTAPEGESLAPGHRRLARGDAIEGLTGFSGGDWWVQDLAASIPARLIGTGPGRVLDLCAAPGGKTMQLAAAGWHVTALDASPKRLERMAQNLERTGLSAELVAGDALTWQPESPFDAILLDAPCTATGTCRRHPDVLHRITARHIAEMAELQATLLSRAATWLRPGGVLVYAVCSLEHEEGEAQAAALTLKPDPIRPDELPQGLAPTPEGWLRTDPAMLADKGGLDGFFIARWRA